MKDLAQSLESRAESRRAMIELALQRGLDPTARVPSLELAAGGNSRETWIVEVRGETGTQKLVFRCDPDHWIRPHEMQREIDGLRVAAQAGVPVPKLLLSSNDIDIGRPFIVTTFVAGEPLARRILRDPQYAKVRRGFAADCGRILAQLHGATALAADWPAVDPLEDIEQFRQNSPFPSAVLAGALRWLVRNRPKPPAVLSPVHRDFRIGNLMCDGDGIVAVLDWETCHRSDPCEDLAWLCSRAWRYGGDKPVGGIGDLEDLLSAYQEHSGTTIDRERLHWWQVYATVRWGYASTARPRAGSAGDAMEEAAIARQLCRQEHYTLLDLERAA